MQIIKQLRSRSGINQSDLAVAIGVSLRTIQLYEKKDANIPIKNLSKIAAFFKLSIAELYLQEVNEEGSNYSAKKIKSAGGNVAYSLPNGKYMVTVPVLLAVYHKQYVKEHQFGQTITMDFVLDNFEEGGFMAFEVIGDAMDDGGIQSIPNGALVLGKLIPKESLYENTHKLLSSDVVVVGDTRIICKRFTGYNPSNDSISCSSLNTSPEYQDFEIPLVEISQVYQVVGKQL